MPTLTQECVTYSTPASTVWPKSIPAHLVCTLTSTRASATGRLIPKGASASQVTDAPDPYPKNKSLFISIYIRKTCVFWLHFLKGPSNSRSRIPTPLFLSDHQVTDNGFKCPEQTPDQIADTLGLSDPHPKYADPEDCAKFYICLNGVSPRSQGCELGLVYNTLTKQCDSPENVPEW